MTGKSSVLVVDDDVNFCNTLAKVLAAKGYEVTKAGEGLRALELFRERSFDVVLMDIKMPRMSGVEVCGEMKKIRREAAVILMTAFSAGEVSEEAMKEGAYTVVPKPFDMDFVMRLMDGIILKKRQV